MKRYAVQIVMLSVFIPYVGLISWLNYRDTLKEQAGAHAAMVQYAYGQQRIHHLEAIVLGVGLRNTAVGSQTSWVWGINTVNDISANIYRGTSVGDSFWPGSCFCAGRTRTVIGSHVRPPIRPIKRKCPLEMLLEHDLNLVQQDQELLDQLRIKAESRQP